MWLTWSRAQLREQRNAANPHQWMAGQRTQPFITEVQIYNSTPTNATTYLVCRGANGTEARRVAQPSRHGFPHVFGLAPDFALFPPATGHRP